MDFRIPFIGVMSLLQEYCMKTELLFPSRISVFSKLERRLKSAAYRGAKFFILVDENTYNHCLPSLVAQVPSLQEADFFEVPLGEDAKQLEVAQQLWNALLESGADRNSVIVNLGGGSISDLGGFVAAGYRRGIRFINIPTTLIGMVDAAIGGKTAVNMGCVKNQVGFFHQPDLVCICPEYLNTLPDEEVLSGAFEIFKSLLLSDSDAFVRLESAVCTGTTLSCGLLMPYLVQCAGFKYCVTKSDPLEHSLRRVLNFGHTFGHGIEGFMLEKGMRMSHGVAVGIGMACALYLSVKKLGMSAKVHSDYCRMLRRLVDVPCFTLRETEQILSFIRNDKKNSEGLILCVLLQNPGVPVIDAAVSEHEVRDALLRVGKE